ncbi:MAG TPA: hypothetical protein VEJ87_00085 [Acidimicrobiales bacterium]|nr:hypothetical protein [Acidimicrobiales bacterium]
MALVFAALACGASFAAIGVTAGSAASEQPPPEAQEFIQSTSTVLAGSSLSVMWAGDNSEESSTYYTITSSLPDFNSNNEITFPPKWRALWSGDGWILRPKRLGDLPSAYGMTVVIPRAATAGTIYTIQLHTCSSADDECSNADEASNYSQITLTVAGANWTSVPFTNDFPTLIDPRQTSGGVPLDVTFDQNEDIFESNEFSNSIDELSSGSTKLTGPFIDPYDASSHPFAYDFFDTWTSSTDSALAERIMFDGDLVWETQGGWWNDECASSPCPAQCSSCPTNQSEIVAFDPSTNNTCTYQLPGDNNEIVGIASTGTAPNNEIWVVEAYGQYLDYFYPSEIAGGCSAASQSSEYQVSPGVGGFGQISLPGELPSQVTADSNGNLWITNLGGSSLTEVSGPTDTVLGTYSYQDQNSYAWAAEPWQVVTDTNYVYAIDYGDNNLVRINKADPTQIDQVPIPVTSTDEEGYGLALDGGKLFFTLADDPHPTFGADSTFGYVNIGAWEAASAQCSPGVDCAPNPAEAVVYSGLQAQVDSNVASDFRGIAVNGNGTVAIADWAQTAKGSNNFRLIRLGE